MKAKKGLGSIPKSLAWIDSTEPITTVMHKPEIKEEKHKQKQPIAISKKPSRMIAQSKNENASTVEIHSPVSDLNTCVKGLPAGWTRATFIVEQEFNEKLKALAYWERLTVKEVMHEALSQYLQGKNVRPIPKKKDII
jgi:hypothetical protein